MDHQKSAFVGPVLCFFVQRSQIPTGQKNSYGNFICDVRPQKSEIRRVRLTVGDDKLDAYKETSSPTVSLIDAKLHFNSTISDAHNGARNLGLDIKNFYLSTPMDHTKFQYLRVHIKDIPPEVLEEYDVCPDEFGSVYLEV